MSKIFIAFLCLFSSAAFALDCSRFWVGGFPYPGRQHERLDCLEFPTSSAEAQLYYPESVATDAATMVLLSNAAEALRASYERFSSIGRMPPVKAVFYTAADPGDGRDGVTTYAIAQIRWHRPGEACPVLIYPAARTFSPEGIKQLIAHELFHCFQKENFPAQTAAGSHPPSPSGLWWLEGTAEFFSNYVYPTVDLEYGHHVGPYLPGNAMTDQGMGYGNVHFFQSLFNHHGVRAVLDFMGHMPTSESANQNEALNSVSEIHSVFHKFAEEIAAHSVRDSSGSIGNTPRPEVTQLADLANTDATQERELVFLRQTVMPYHLKFPKKGTYRLQWVLPEGARGSYRRVGENTWATLPENFDSACEEDSNLEILISMVDSSVGMESAQLYVDRTEKTDCPCEPVGRPTDSCLFGRWQVDHSTILAMMNRQIRGPSGAQAISSDGVFVIELNEAGEMRWILAPWKTVVKAPLTSGVEMIMEQIYNGMTLSRYTNGEGKICSQITEANLSITKIVTIGGRSTTTTSTLGSAAPGNFTYTCTRNTLTYHQPVDGPAAGMIFEYVFHRL